MHTHGNRGSRIRDLALHAHLSFAKLFTVHKRFERPARNPPARSSDFSTFHLEPAHHDHSLCPNTRKHEPHSTIRQRGRSEQCKRTSKPQQRGVVVIKQIWPSFGCFNIPTTHTRGTSIQHHTGTPNCSVVFCQLGTLLNSRLSAVAPRL